MKQARGQIHVGQTGGVKPRTISGRTILFNWQGYIVNFQDWDEEVARELARERGLEVLTEDHWRALRFLREYYSFNGRMPLNRELRENTGLSLIQIESLFPGGFKKQAPYIAGLPLVTTCGGPSRPDRPDDQTEAASLHQEVGLQGDGVLRPM